MRKAFLPFYSIVLGSLALVSCRTQPQYAAVPTPSEIAPWLAGDSVYAAAQSLSVSGRGQALAYCRQCLNRVVPSFTLNINYGNPVKEMSVIAQELLDTGQAVAMEMENTGNSVRFVPQYSDCVLMLKAYREPAFKAILPARTQKALQKAQQIVEQVCSQHSSDYARAVAFHDYIARHTRYESRLGIAAQEDATTKLLLDGIAVCDGYAHAYGLLLSMAGIENRFVVGKGDGIEHIWNMVQLNGQWVHVDVTYDDPKPDKEGRILHSYFAMSDSLIATNHQWKRADFPRAATESLYYPFYTGRRFASAADMLNWAAAQRVGSPWHVTVYVDELKSLRSDSAAYAKLQAAAAATGANQLRAVALDKGCRGAVYCSFEY